MVKDHPLWVSYEQDLSRLLVDLDPGDRAEVLAGIREHVSASLADRPKATSADVQAVLAELGPPEAVAQEAYAGQVSQRSPAPLAPVSVFSKSWVPVVLAHSGVGAVHGGGDRTDAHQLCDARVHG